MPKQFIRKFDASTYKHGARGIYSMAIRTRGDYVFLRGQTGFDLDGNFVGKGDPGAQAEQASRNIKQLMEEAGGSIKDVCKLTVYVTDVSYRPAVYRMIEKHFEGVHHCSTGVVVQGLALPELMVEIDAFAVIDR
ncbi:MAG: enamine deaminase RidA [Candidatus Rokuibacteriota bacterium]|nr:MAG: enamine deaminase RidA [Candidatus Rokubacteria bacterium]PYN64352.1 MAG: enamine deaminase RidA [Candidatus Rokubacteria bacterium]